MITRGLIAQMKFSIKDFFCKRFLGCLVTSAKEILDGKMKNFILCAVAALPTVIETFQQTL